jgi:hypothetical protein
MTEPHKDSDLAMVATTKLDDPAIAELAAQAANAARTNLGWKSTWATVQLDQVKPGALSLSVRGPGGSPVQLAFALETAPGGEDGLTALRARITSYRTVQDTMYGIIPAGPRRISGLPNYQKFLTAFCASLRAADPAAVIIPDVRTGRAHHDRSDHPRRPNHGRAFCLPGGNQSNTGSIVGRHPV